MHFARKGPLCRVRPPGLSTDVEIRKHLRNSWDEGRKMRHRGRTCIFNILELLYNYLK